MTITPEKPAVAEDLITATIDGFEVHVPKGTLIIRAAEQLGIQIPRFCDHPALDPVGACRQCIVEVEGQRKPLASCTSVLMDGYAVKTQLTSAVAEKAQRGTMELLLINHPLDCPICDKGGECPLQNQAMSNGQASSRFHDVKRTFDKPVPISSQVLLDRERCVLCARCTRFSDQIAGDPLIEFFERGAHQQVAIYDEGENNTDPFQSYFSGNTIQICPVGALTGAAYRFRSRPYDLVSTPSVCEHCASGCAQRTDSRHGTVLRRLSGNDPDVNSEWNCDKGRWAFTYNSTAASTARIDTPLVRDESGQLVAASWTHALEIAARGIGSGRNGAVLAGGRLTVEDAYAYSKFARLVFGSNDVDFRARPASAEETAFLGAHVAGTGPVEGTSPTYADLAGAPVVLLVGFEPEEESPIVFLRLRKAARDGALKVFGVAPFSSPGLAKCFGTLVQSRPGDEASVLGAITADSDLGVALRESGAVILAGERLATSPGALTAVAALASSTGAKLGWIPRRAGDRGAIEAGLLPTLLPGARPVADAQAREQLATAWGTTIDRIPAEPGRDAAGIIAAAAAGEIDGLLVAGVDLDDLPDPVAARAALAKARFVVVTEVRHSAATAFADVVLPVAAVVEKAGTYLDWEGRARPFERVLPDAVTQSDLRVIHQLAGEIGLDLRLPTVEAARAEIATLPHWTGAKAAAPSELAGSSPEPAAGEALLASWHWLLDEGTLQEAEPHLAGTRRAPRLHLSAATAAEIGAEAGQHVQVSTPTGAVTLPLIIAGLPDRVVWIPTKSPGSHLSDLGAVPGDVVTLSALPAVVAAPVPEAVA